MVEVREDIRWTLIAVAEYGDPEVYEVNDLQTLTIMYHRMEKEGRAVGPRCLMQLSLIRHAYVTCLREGRLEHLEGDDEESGEVGDMLVTDESVIEMRYVRASSSEDSTHTYSTTDRQLLDMLLAL